YNAVGAYRRDVTPARSLPDFFRHNLLAAPRGQDGIGCGCDDSFRRDDTILGCGLPRQSSKYVLAARDLNQLRHPADTTDQRLVPFLEIDPWPRMIRHRRGYFGEASFTVKGAGAASTKPSVGEVSLIRPGSWNEAKAPGRNPNEQGRKS